MSVDSLVMEIIAGCMVILVSYMLTRLNSLEKRIADLIENDIVEIKERLARLEGRMESLSRSIWKYSRVR